MKNFTRFILALSMISTFGVANAQYDLTANSITATATSSNEVPPGTPIVLTLEFENTGPQLIPDQSTALLVFLNGTDTIQTIEGVFNGDMAVGAIYTFNSDPFTLPATPPNVNLCGFILLTSSPELDSTDNLVCDAYTVSTTANLDIKTKGLVMVSPTAQDLDSFDIFDGDNTPPNITGVYAEFKNNGNITFPAGFGIPYAYEFEGNVVVYLGTLTAAMAPGDSTTRPTVDPSFMIPTEFGDYEICLFNYYGDDELGNDTLCHQWTMIDTYTPPPPVGVEENSFVSNQTMFYYNRALYVKNVRNAVNITVVDASGKIFTQSTMIEDGSISFEDAVPGVYVVQSTNSANGNTSMQKIVVQ